VTDARAVLAAHMSERELQDHVLTLAGQLGYRVWHDQATNHARRCPHCGGELHGPRNARGWPDLALTRERLVFAELKTARNTLTPDQELWRARLIAAGQHVHVWKPADLADGTIARALRGEREG
jgi:hypothetical protein